MKISVGHDRYRYESTTETRKSVAKEIMKAREEEIKQGQHPTVYAVTFDHLAKDLLLDYEVRGLAHGEKVKSYLHRHLRPFFGSLKAKEITSTKINEYIGSKQREGLSSATINRILQALKRMFNLGTRQTPPKVFSVPYIPKLEERNIREGFFEPNDYKALLKELSLYFRPVLTFGYITGWRRGRILSLKCSQVDMEAGLIMPEVNQSETKSVGPISFELFPALGDLMRDLKKRRPKGCPSVFHLKGRQIKEPNQGWKAACERAGLPGMLFHDLRRTAIRNMVRAGVSERVAMSISGHKTRAIFDRYNIVNLTDLQEAGRKMQRYLEKNGTVEKLLKLTPKKRRPYNDDLP